MGWGNKDIRPRLRPCWLCAPGKLHVCNGDLHASLSPRWSGCLGRQGTAQLCWEVRAGSQEVWPHLEDPLAAVTRARVAVAGACHLRWRLATWAGPPFPCNSSFPQNKGSTRAIRKPSCLCGRVPEAMLFLLPSLTGYTVQPESVWVPGMAHGHEYQEVSVIWGGRCQRPAAKCHSLSLICHLGTVPHFSELSDSPNKSHWEKRWAESLAPSKCSPNGTNVLPPSTPTKAGGTTPSLRSPTDLTGARHSILQ